MIIKTLNLLHQELTAIGIKDEQFVNGLQNRSPTDGQINWVGQLFNNDKRLFYTPVIFQRNGVLDFQGVSAVVVNGMGRIDQNGASTDRLEKNMNDYLMAHYKLPTVDELRADVKYGHPVLDEFSKLYSVHPQIHYSYWSVYCYGDPPLPEAAISDFRSHEQEQVRFVHYPAEERLNLSHMYALLADPECPRPYFNRNSQDFEPKWLQVDYHPQNIDDDPTKLCYYPDYDLNMVLRTLNVDECNGESSRQKLDRTLRAGIAASVTPVGSKPADAVMLVADPKNKYVIALDFAQRRIEMSTLLAPKDVIEKRELEIGQGKTQRIVKQKQDNGRKQLPG
ncbi:hypothetical protein [Chitinophaga arvensicola]|uniref:Uncharacterized protein n=1 Tax=Chitinophaga arvensicola TaxID=29529 RepID=A0A1I0PN78_9BACT|nr:hypothetical protein [Chitinophaga arvensicola]SEW15695.1 hypothetical protein SAMN04488122_0874 [Chitinophaga arvensicola]